MLHVELLTAWLNAVQHTLQGRGSQIFAKMADSPVVVSRSDCQDFRYEDRQRSKRIEAMLLLPNGKTPVSMPPGKAARVTTLLKTNANAPLNLSLTPCYIDCPLVALRKRCIIRPGSR